MYVKVCGITELEDAVAAVEAGADALGFNCIAASKRFVERARIRSIVSELRHALPARPALCVAVVADVAPADALGLLDELGLDRVQLHGQESAALLQAIGPRAYKAVRIGGEADVAAAAAFPGHPLLVDAKVSGQLGGTGHTLDWPLVAPLARARPLILAGGLTPANVSSAVRAVQPWGVDVASGVERDGSARRKDPEKMRRFVEAARGASRGEHRAAF